MKLRVGTRPSELSIKQTLEAIDAIRSKYPDIELEIIKIRTKGDIDRKTPLYEMPVKGIFEKEVDLALIRGDVDFVVHSLKDYPTIVDPQLELASIPKRKSPYDVILCRKHKGLSELPSGAIIGTSSLRRMTHLKYFRPDLNVIPIRGNVDTRIRKLWRGDCDAIVIAEVGIQRLNLDLAYEVLSFDVMVPAAGQGALAVVCRKGDSEIKSLLKSIEDPPSRFEVEVERKILRHLRTGCRTPIGVNVRIQGDKAIASISSVSPDGKLKVYIIEEHEYPCSIDDLAYKAYMKFKDNGGLEIIELWREKAMFSTLRGVTI